MGVKHTTLMTSTTALQSLSSTVYPVLAAYYMWVATSGPELELESLVVTQGSYHWTKALVKVVLFLPSSLPLQWSP